MTEETNTTIQVSGTCETLKPKNVISVDLTWGAMEFTYYEQTKGTWNPNTHSYENIQRSWIGDNGTGYVNVVNHSNVAVTADFSFESNYASTIDGMFAQISVHLQSAEGKEIDETNSYKNHLTIFATSTINKSHHNKEIGKAIIKIKAVIIEDVIEVSTKDDIRNACSTGGLIKLMNDIEIDPYTQGLRPIAIGSNVNVTIDLNGKTLSNITGQVISVGNNSKVTIKNGEIKSSSTAIGNNGELTLENVKIISTSDSIYMAFNSITTLKNCTLNSNINLLIVQGSAQKIILEGTTTLPQNSIKVDMLYSQRSSLTIDYSNLDNEFNIDNYIVNIGETTLETTNQNRVYVCRCRL